MACRSGSPPAKLTIARRVQVMWSSHSLRIASWKASWRAVSAVRRGCVTVGADEGFVMGARRMRLVGTGRGHRERRARQRYEHDRRGRDATPPQSFNRVHDGSLLAARALTPPLGWQRWRAAMRPAACTPWVSRPIASTGSTCSSSGPSPTVLLSE